MSDRVRLWAVVVAGILLGASPVWAISEYKVATATGTGTAKVFISGVPNARVVALVSADGPSKAGSQAATVSGCVQSWVRVKRANTAYGLADVWSAPTGNLSGCTVTARLSSSGYFLRLVVIVLDGAAGIGSSVSASGFSGPAAATLTSLQPGSLVYGVGSDWSVVQGRTVLSGQRILAQSTPSGLGTFWGQALTGTTSASSLTVGTSAPASGNWNFAAVEILATDAPPPPPPPPPPSCTFSVSPASLAFSASGGSSNLTVTASDPSCAWGASTGSAWLSVAPTTSTGSGSVTVTSAANNGSARSGSVTVAGTSVSVSQDGAPVAPAPLTIACPANKTATSPDGQPVAVTYPDATTNGGTAPITVVGSPASGSLFAVGTTSVTQTATSNDGQTASCGFSVTVTYTAPPPPPPGGGQTITASSASQAAVASAIASANTGDTVIVPAGSASWSGLSINKAIHLKGSGIGVTTITLTGSNAVTKQAAGVTRISGFSFSKSGGGNGSKGFVFSGPWPSAQPIVFEGNAVTISGTGFILISVPGGVVIANNSFRGAWDDSFIQPKQPGDSDGSWVSNSTMGTADTTGTANLYIEGNSFYGGTNQGIDCDDGARCVFRYNDCQYMSFNSHGLDTSEDGVRHFEVYGNQFRNAGWTGSSAITDTSNQNWAIWIRGGTGVIFDNVIDNIANSFWGFGKSEAKFDIRAQQDGSGSSYGTLAPPIAKYSAGRGDYPRERQLGQSWSLSLRNSVGLNGGIGDYVTDPIYVWGNTGAGSDGQGGFLDWANGGSWGSQSGYFTAGRDYVIGSPKPGYTPYVYPHPLRTN